jgi:HemY protein
MKRLALFALGLVLLVAIAVWFADRPGTVSIAWQGRIVEVSVGFAVVIAAVAVVVAVLLHDLWRWLRRAPRNFVVMRRIARRERGYKALTRGLVAVAAGDAEAAHRYARRADVLLDEPPLTLLLSAQAAQLNGEDEAATRYFETMLQRPETEFLGLRGLLNQALKRRDPIRGLEFARRARLLRPDTAWAQRACFELEVGQRRWDDALVSLAQAVRIKAIETDEGRRLRVALLVERSRAAEAVDDHAAALEAAHKAVSLAPEFVPAILRESHMLARAGRPAQAARTLERGWGRVAHRDVAEAYAALGDPGEDALVRVKRVEKLLRARPDEVEALIAVARAELAARLWGSARTHLLKAEQITPNRRVYTLLATLETAERNDPIAARSWTAKAQLAPPEEAWICGRCGTVQPAWSLLCDACGGFDTMAWRAPVEGARLQPHDRSLLPVPASPPAAGNGDSLPTAVPSAPPPAAPAAQAAR